MRLIEEEKRDGAGKKRARTRASAKSCGTEHIEYKTSGTRWYRVVGLEVPTLYKLYNTYSMQYIRPRSVVLRIYTCGSYVIRR